MSDGWLSVLLLSVLLCCCLSLQVGAEVLAALLPLAKLRMESGQMIAAFDLSKQALLRNRADVRPSE